MTTDITESVLCFHIIHVLHFLYNPNVLDPSSTSLGLFLKEENSVFYPKTSFASAGKFLRDTGVVGWCDGSG